MAQLLFIMAIPAATSMALTFLVGAALKDAGTAPRKRRRRKHR